MSSHRGLPSTAAVRKAVCAPRLATPLMHLLGHLAAAGRGAWEAAMVEVRRFGARFNLLRALRPHLPRSTAAVRDNGSRHSRRSRIRNI